MQRVLSAFSKDRKLPFSQKGLAIPNRDKLQMKIKTREAISFSWQQAKKMALQVRKLNLTDSRKEQYPFSETIHSHTAVNSQIFAYLAHGGVGGPDMGAGSGPK
jgi:hypothetical protein